MDCILLHTIIHVAMHVNHRGSDSEDSSRTSTVNRASEQRQLPSKQASERASKQRHLAINAARAGDGRGCGYVIWTLGWVLGWLWTRSCGARVAMITTVNIN